MVQAVHDCLPNKNAAYDRKCGAEGEVPSPRHNFLCISTNGIYYAAMFTCKGLINFVTY